jgi:hypothetical protein
VPKVGEHYARDDADAAEQLGGAKIELAHRQSEQNLPVVLVRAV